LSQGRAPGECNAETCNQHIIKEDDSHDGRVCNQRSSKDRKKTLVFVLKQIHFSLTVALTVNFVAVGKETP
jgi:hypothetical protein